MSRVRARIERILDWAAVRGYRRGDNPAQWRGHLSEALPARAEVAPVEHHPALPFVQMPEFWTDLCKREGSAARALQFTILTAARTGEVIGATWPEIDFESKLWAIPGERMKAGREHKVPLSDPAIELLKSLCTGGDNDCIFVGSRLAGLSNMSMSAVVKRMGRTGITIHGFRSTFRDWAAERTSFANHIVEMALAHAIGDAVEKAYRRGELLTKRKALMQAWARFCTSAEAGVVVSMRRAS
jgi:integrase